jgi:hypothetical protein
MFLDLNWSYIKQFGVLRFTYTVMACNSIEIVWNFSGNVKFVFMACQPHWALAS